MADDEVDADAEVVTTPGEDAEVLDVDPDAEVVSFRYAITSYGADFPVDALVARLNSKDIVIPRFGDENSGTEDVRPFQRSRVWTKRQKDRFLESLLLGLPVPEIFLVLEPSGVYLVLDGQQRLTALQDFIKGTTAGREFRLSVVQEDLQKTYDELDEEDQRRLRNALIHATIVRQDEPSDGQSSIYTLFERINTGGTNLQPQEIRVALFHGTFVDLIHELNKDSNWRELYGRESPRLKDQELILRFFALLHRDAHPELAYSRPMKEFLSKFLDWNRNLEHLDAAALGESFRKTVAAINSGLGRAAFRISGNQVNAAVLDSVMVGVAQRLSAGVLSDPTSLRAPFDQLVQSQQFLQSVQRATADEASVERRLGLSALAFHAAT